VLRNDPVNIRLSDVQTQLRGIYLAVIVRKHMREGFMITQSIGNAAAAYISAARSSLGRQASMPQPADFAGSVQISGAARAALASETSAGDAGVQRRIDEIKAKPGVFRTQEDGDYLYAHDKRFAEIRDKSRDDGGAESLTADELDYLQKAGGFVNTMAELSTDEKALYDELVAQGNTEAAAALNLIAMSRIGMGGQQITLPNGRVFDPTTTEITADNVRNLFRYLHVDETGHTDRLFESLTSYLERRDDAKTAARNRVDT